MTDVGRDQNRRRSERFRFVLPVRVNVTGPGILIDLSETGALLRLPRAQEPQKQVTVAIEGQPSVQPLPARVVRCTKVSVETETATLARTEYEVAVEFLGAGQQTAARIRLIIEAQK